MVLHKTYEALLGGSLLPMCYVGNRLVLTLRANKGVHYQRQKYTTQTPGCPLDNRSKEKSR